MSSFLAGPKGRFRVLVEAGLGVDEIVTTVSLPHTPALAAKTLVTSSKVFRTKGSFRRLL